MRWARPVRTVVGLTVVLGAVVVVSWLAVRGLSVFTGPGPFLDTTWFAVWGVQAALAAVAGFVLGGMWGRETSAMGLCSVVAAAWVGELLVVTAMAPLLAGELSVASGPWLWLVATGGPIQPLAAALGLLIGRSPPLARPPTPR